MKALVSILFVFSVSISVHAQKPDPIIDVHLHAMAANSQGPPPLAMCAPFEMMPVWDQTKPYAATFMRLFKDPPCKNPVWSPKTDREVMTQTIEVMNRLNIYGVLSGKPDRVAAWKRAAPGRFYSGLGFQIGRDKYTPADLRRCIVMGVSRYSPR